MSLAFTNFLSGTKTYRLGENSQPILKDYQHAARLYLDSSYSKIPKFGFIYFVEININAESIIENTWKSKTDHLDVGLLAKRADLPKFSITNETLNQYNRKTIVQTKIAYTPISIDFHDDASNITHTLWTSYYKHYYADSNYGDPGISKLSAGQNPEAYSDTKYSTTDFIYGRYARPTNQFLSSISIYVLHQQKFTKYTLVNPKITEWAHDSVTQSDNAKILQNRMTVAYENVLYAEGAIEKQKNPERWIPRFYDTNPSPYTIGGATPVSQTVNRPVDQVQNKERIFGRIGGAIISSAIQTDYGGRSSFDSYINPSTGQRKAGTYFGSSPSRSYGRVGGQPVMSPANQSVSRLDSVVPTNTRNYGKIGGYSPMTPTGQFVSRNSGFDSPSVRNPRAGAPTSPTSPVGQIVSILAKDVLNKKGLGKLGPVGYNIAAGVLGAVLGSGQGKYSSPPPTQSQPGILKLPGGIGINIFKGLNRGVDGKIRANPAAIIFPRRG
jgi:hypothetical protein